VIDMTDMQIDSNKDSWLESIKVFTT